MSVLVATYRDPIHWAKVAATIDWLSEGRFILGVGIGWMREEFEALGRSDIYDQRAQVAEEQLQIVASTFNSKSSPIGGARRGRTSP